MKVDTFGTAKVNEEVLSDAVNAVFDLTPKGIIDGLDLLRPIYRHSAYHGHFGRKEFPWEDTAKAAELLDAVAKLEADEPVAKMAAKKAPAKKRGRPAKKK